MKFKGASLSSPPNLQIVNYETLYFEILCTHELRGTFCQMGDHPATEESIKISTTRTNNTFFSNFSKVSYFMDQTVCLYNAPVQRPCNYKVFATVI